MKSLFKVGGFIIGVTTFAFLMTGCSITYRAGIYPIPSDLKVKEFRGEGEFISINNEAAEGAKYIGTASPYTHYADMKQVTDVTASFLGAELSKRGFSVQRDAIKTITLNVIEVNLTYTIAVYHCNMKMEYATSDGYKRIIFPYNSGGTYNRACNGAVTRGIVDLLNDSKLIDFLKSKER
jgi:hypothetical protein